MFAVYCLQSTSGKTYVGATVDVDRRLRQHNCEITGGARMTGAAVAAGESWLRICYVTGFPDWRAALQFEWRWKQISRKLKGVALENRIRALKTLLALDRPTTAAQPYSEWPTQPQIIWESDEAEFTWLSL
jgi:predicted GIY-YIG superfamily endonuclease